MIKKLNLNPVVSGANILVCSRLILNKKGCSFNISATFVYFGIHYLLVLKHKYSLHFLLVFRHKYSLHFLIVFRHKHSLHFLIVFRHKHSLHFLLVFRQVFTNSSYSQFTLV